MECYDGRKMGGYSVLMVSLPALNFEFVHAKKLTGSGKSTIISVISSDHPQSYAVPLQIFGKDRLPSKGSPGISYFEIHSRLGISSPEFHNSFS